MVVPDLGRRRVSMLIQCCGGTDDMPRMTRHALSNQTFNMENDHASLQDR